MFLFISFKKSVISNLWIPLYIFHTFIAKPQDFTSHVIDLHISHEQTIVTVHLL